MFSLHAFYVSAFNRHSPFHFLATSCVGSSERLNVSPRVRDQSEAPISPTTATVDAAGHREGSGLTSCHTDPASQGQNPSPLGDSQPLRVISASRSHRGYWREKDEERQ